MSMQVLTNVTETSPLVITVSQDNGSNQSTIIKRLNDFIKNYFVSFSFALPFATSSYFMHEVSHIAVMECLFINVDPYIHCRPFICGVGHGPNMQIRPGSSLNEASSVGFVCAAGPLSDLINTAFTSIAAWKLRQSYPRISLALAINAFVIGCNVFGYALMDQFSYFVGDFSCAEIGLGIPKAVQSVITGIAFLITTISSAMLCHAFNKRFPIFE